MLQHQSYYSTLNQTDNNENRSDINLVVNCAGLYSSIDKIDRPFRNVRQDFYLQYIYEGSLNVIVNSEKFTLVAGDVIVYPANQLFKYNKPKGEVLSYYWIHFTGYDAAELIESSKINFCEPQNIGKSSTIVLFFEEIFLEFIHRDDLFQRAATCKLVQLIIEFSRKTNSSKKAVTTEKKRILNSIAYIHKNLRTDLSCEFLASQQHLSSSYYRYLFKKITGVSPMNYITALRINRAKNMLRYSDRSVKVVSEDVGFSNQLYFSKYFKKTVGESPSEYRSKI